MDENAELQNFYSFRHHMLCEYFASRCIDNLSVSPTVLLLIITGETSLRNLQKIIFQTMLQQDKQELLLTIMFGILILQNEKKISEKQVPEPILNLCQSMKTINRDELIPAQSKLETRKVTDAWEPIIQYIDNLAETLRDLEWFHDLEENGTIKHIVECLEFCNSRRSEKLTRQTLHRLLPCTYCQDDGEHTDFPVGKSRWGHVLKAKAVFVKAWSVRDTHEALTKHRTQYPNLSLTRMEMNINYFKYRILWGKATDAEWSPEAWNGLMAFLTDTWTLKKLSIYLPYTCPLSGLLTCLATLDPDKESHCLFVEIHYGTVRLEDLETFVDECHDAGLSIILVRTNITIPGTKEDSFLRRRRDELCATKAGKGQEVVQDMFWVKTNGERFNWSDEM